jgi:hypothetical protein
MHLLSMEVTPQWPVLWPSQLPIAKSKSKMLLSIVSLSQQAHGNMIIELGLLKQHYGVLFHTVNDCLVLNK